jgi:hypothetical protein
MYDEERSLEILDRLLYLANRVRESAQMQRHELA